MNVLVAAMDFLCRNMLFVVLLTIAGYCKSAKRAKAQFAETSMARTDSGCEYWETATYDCLVWVWSWQGPCTVGHCEHASILHFAFMLMLRRILAWRFKGIS